MKIPPRPSPSPVIRLGVAEAMSVGDTQYRRAVLRGLILHLMALRHRLYRRRLAAVRAWQEADRAAYAERAAARQRIIERAQAERDERDEVGRAAA